MNRKRTLLLAIAAMIIIVIPLFTSKASEVREVHYIKSTGNIVYKSNAGSVELYAEDIALLQECLKTKDEIFSPQLYTHVHSWIYSDINPKSHKKHCSVCGDVIENHKVSSVSFCTISYDEKEYLGYTKACECGYEWENEQSHNIVYESKNDSSHTLSCVLSGTSYCSGMDSLEEEHSMMYYATDESHHMEYCSKCGFEKGEKQECSFDEEVTEEDQEETKKYCKCGNYITESSGGCGESIPEVPDTDDEESSLDDLTEKLSEGGSL